MRVSAVVIFLAMAASSCASSSSPSALSDVSPATVATTTPAVSLDASATTPSSSTPVQGAFTATSYQDSTGEHSLISGTSMMVEFRVEGGRDIINWTGGCNSSGTTYTITDGRLHLTQVVGSTVVLCNQALMDQDMLLGGVLSAAPEVIISRSAVRIADSQFTITFSPTSEDTTSLTS